MTELKPKKALLDALMRASSHKPTADEIQKQRESFILGSLKMDSGVTRDKVREILRKQAGQKG